MANDPSGGPIQGPQGPSPVRSGFEHEEPQMQGQEVSKPFSLEEQTPGVGTDAPSPMELASMHEGRGAELNHDTLKEHVQSLQGKIKQLQGGLTTDRYNEMTDAQKALLQSKLGQFNKNMQGLSRQVGLKYDTPQASRGLADVKTFLGWLTHSQHQLTSVAQNLGEQSKGKITVAGMMRAQAQMMAAERAINFATAVVSKGTDFIKQIFQTQL